MFQRIRNLLCLSSVDQGQYVFIKPSFLVQADSPVDYNKPSSVSHVQPGDTV